ncbi:MAG: Zn-ribbon domain-containing OB-fold protein [Dehalococcoidales bacterium]|nr:Zn-ribbon domain-containing OB-fold protein [Dehalococcoidales bacterium]
MEYKLTFKEYNEALKTGKLLGLKCKDCGSITAPPKMVCRKCGSAELEIVPLKGAGKIRTFSTINVAAEGREAECPYVIVMVEMEEGPWLLGSIAGVEPLKATMDIIGKKVKMTGGAIFGGDKYSAGESARPLFALA